MTLPRQLYLVRYTWETRETGRKKTNSVTEIFQTEAPAQRWFPPVASVHKDGYFTRITYTPSQGRKKDSNVCSG